MAWFLGVAVVCLVVDQITKGWALRTLDDGHIVSLIPGVLRLELMHNSGAAFSFGSKVTWVFTALAAAVCVGLVMVSRRLISRGWAIALGLILGGAGGNLIDRLVRPPSPGKGYVVDFIGYGNLFIGNVADIAICGAAVLLTVLTVRGVRPWESRS